ncbi:MAG: hypothetical protein KIIPBIDF_00352 [Candidatus Methanoperedenaceae archaeon GB50]|nr:MAG: hypothetical protein KIIPBIDF_00352 [Candidatus Methanoperedenaceae archaeon GB50]
MKGWSNKILLPLFFFFFLLRSLCWLIHLLRPWELFLWSEQSSISGYSTGNCAHCHEQHAMIGGTEPQPASGSASPFCLLQIIFSGTKSNTYQQSDNFCFYCHCYTDATSLQTPNFTNYNYSRTFGGYTPSSIYSIYKAFNQNSYHNLYDIWEFAKTNFSSFFKEDSNPCSACHNVHLAKEIKKIPMTLLIQLFLNLLSISIFGPRQ